MKFKLLIFDLDDTLINNGGHTSETWEKASKEAIDELKLNIDYVKLAEEIVRVSDDLWFNEATRPKGNFIFNDVRKKTVNIALKNLEIKNPVLASILVKNYNRAKNEVLCAFDDVIPTLLELKKRGYKLAILANGPSYIQRDKIKRFKLEDLFDQIFIDGEMGVGRPEKEAYDNVLNYFKVDAKDTCNIGCNYLLDVIETRKFGISTVFVNRKEEQESVANYTIRNIKELLNFL